MERRHGPLEAAVEVARRLREAGFQSLFAGGCVRDRLLGRVPKDYDVATDARPEQVRKLFRRTVEVGAAFGVVRVMIGPHQVETATFRTDLGYADGRHPTAVRFADARADAARRDFTVNGMFLDPLTEEVVDYVDGRRDLAAGVVRAIGNADDRIAEDRLRMLRAVRLATVLEFTVEPATAEAIRRHAGEIMSISAERVRDELARTLGHPRRAEGVRLLWDLGLVEPILPEAFADYGRPATVPEGLAAAVASLPAEAAWDVALALMVKGPAPATDWDDAGMTLRRAAAAQRADSVEELGRRLALTRPERIRIEFLIRNRCELDDSGRHDLAWKKRLFARPHFAELVDFHRACRAERPAGPAAADEAIALWRSLTPEQIKPTPLVTGSDLLTMGMSAGPALGALLERLYDAQLNGELVQRSAALDQARRWAGL
jgi:poly(A) polymerase